MYYLTLCIACYDCGSDVNILLTCKPPTEEQIRSTDNGYCAIRYVVPINLNENVNTDD